MSSQKFMRSYNIELPSYVYRPLGMNLPEVIISVILKIAVYVHQNHCTKIQGSM